MVHSTATLTGRPDGVGSITVQEKEKFAEIKERLKALLQHQITNFRYAFPFGRPEGALKVSWVEELLLSYLLFSSYFRGFYLRYDKPFMHSKS